MKIQNLIKTIIILSCVMFLSACKNDGFAEEITHKKEIVICKSLTHDEIYLFERFHPARHRSSFFTGHYMKILDKNGDVKAIIDTNYFSCTVLTDVHDMSKIMIKGFDTLYGKSHQ